MIAPGTGLQSAVEVDSGANGVCETRARGDDLQAEKVGQGAPFEMDAVDLNDLPPLSRR